MDRLQDVYFEGGDWEGWRGQRIEYNCLKERGEIRDGANHVARECVARD